MAVLQPACGQAPRLRFDHLTLDDGLSHSTVETITQGPHGFLWFGTSDGLNRYDGSGVRVYRHVPGDTTTLSSAAVESLLVDPDGRLWVGTKNGLNLYNPANDSFVRYRLVPSDSSETAYSWIHDLDATEQGIVWVGTYGRGLVRLDPETGRTRRYTNRPGDSTSLSSNYVWSLEVDGRGDVWIGTAQHGLNRLNPDSNSVSRYSGGGTATLNVCSKFVRSLLADREGRLWVGTGKGLSRFNAERTRSTSYCITDDRVDASQLSSPNIDDLYQDRRGRIWIATDGGGLNLYRPSTDGFVHYRSNPADARSLSSDVVRSIFQDRCGDLWFGNFIGGVNHFNANNTTFRLYQHRPGDPTSLSHDAVLAFDEDATGNVWIGTDGGGLNVFRPETESFQRYVHDPDDPNTISGNKVVSVMEDRNGIVWAGTSFGGLNRYDPDTGVFRHFTADGSDTTSISVNSIWDLYEDREGRLWVGTYGGGLDRLHRRTQTFEHHRHRAGDSTSLAHDRVIAIYEDSDSDLWIGTEGGLSRMVEGPNGTISFNNYDRENGPPSSLTENWILVLHEDEDGHLWIGTHGGGLNRLDPDTGTFRAYQSDDGLPSDIVYGILEDEEGDLWVSTKKGISEFDPETESVTSYEDTYRLQPGLFNRPNAYLRHSSGDFYFGGTKGFNVFDPDSVRQNACEPPVQITDVQVMHEPVPIGGRDAPLRRHVLVADTLRLDHDQSVLSLRFAALNFRMPSKNRYRYKLDGFDENWRTAEDRQRATYTNLDAGTYQFRVRGANNSGLWSSDEASLTIVVDPPFWKTWWFYGLVTFVLVGLLVGFHRYRLWHIRRHNDLLEKRLAERETYEKRLVAAKERAEEMHRLKSAFLANMSHEIRTPLTTIIGFAEVLEDKFEPQFAERIVESARRLKRTLESVLQLSQLESGSYELQLQTVDVVEIIRDQMTMLESHTANKDVDVILDATPEQIEAETDVRCLERIIANVLSNAIKFTAEGEVRIEVQTDESHLRLAVHDTGQGIDPAFLSEVFEVFTQESSGLDRSYEGTGLGLPVTKRLVTVLDGEIDISSEKGVGTTVTIRLPLTQERSATERDIPRLQEL